MDSHDISYAWLHNVMMVARPDMFSMTCSEHECLTEMYIAYEEWLYKEEKNVS